VFRQAHDNGIHMMLLNHLTQLVIRPDNARPDKPFPYLPFQLVKKSDDLKHQPGFRQDDLAQVNGQLPCPKNEQTLLETWRAP
jgi:hypothetical protein